jgi:hypothetical protein
MAQANHALFQILTNPAPPAVDTDPARHRQAVLCHQAHAELIAKLLPLKPHRIANGRAVYEDIEARGEHLQHVLQAVQAYFHEIVADTNDNVGLGTIDEKYLDNFLSDLISETTGAFAQCAEQVDEDLGTYCGGSQS